MALPHGCETAFPTFVIADNRVALQVMGAVVYALECLTVERTKNKEQRTNRDAGFFVLCSLF
jgi:hypothetical protein